MKSNYVGKCEECLATVEYMEGDPIVGEVITCPECGSDLEIITIERSSYTLNFRKVKLQGEDWGE
ncbi:MAG: lysine biosynthesis protein LysW [Candidatus Aenigmatarchaeota archaeon]